MVENKRGPVRPLPDPVAIATKGRVTTYEEQVHTVTGVPTKLNQGNIPIKLKVRAKNTSGKTYSVNYTLDLTTYPGSRKGLTFDISTGATNAT